MSITRLILEYSIDKGSTWRAVTPEDNIIGEENFLKIGENELKINQSSKHLMLRIRTETGHSEFPYTEISDINIIYREKNLK
jgi:hypothetical protein